MFDGRRHRVGCGELAGFDRIEVAAQKLSHLSSLIFV
jgi:hypothetical protein